MNIPGQRLLLTIAIVLIMLVDSGCAGRGTAVREQGWTANVVAFERELQDLRAELAIPGLAYVIVENGEAIASGAFGAERGATAAPFATSSALRVASVTKSLTAVIAMQLVEENRLDLDTPVRRYAPALAAPEDVLVRHLLTHTSEGIVGQEYVYGTTRYAMLGKVIEAIAGESFTQVIRERVLERAGMNVYASPALAAHAGLVSTTTDMGAYLAALDDGRLLNAASLDRLASPSRSTAGTPLPVSLGWFVQTIQGHRVVWSFGQDDPEHSGALLMRVPERGLSLFILANSNVLSDAFRLLMGDVSKSPFATSFLRLFVFSGRGVPLPRPDYSAPDLAHAVAAIEARTPYRYGDELVGWALIDLWSDRAEAGQRKLDIAAARYDLNERPDAVLHFAALRLLQPLRKDEAIRVGQDLLAAHPNNRWVLLAQGYLLQQRDRTDESSDCFRRILALPNQEPDFLWRLFRAWSWMALAQMTSERDPVAARSYLRQIVESGVGGDVLNEATRMLDDLGGAVPPPR